MKKKEMSQISKAEVIVWLKKKLPKLMEYTQIICDHFPKAIYYKAHSWTPLKLICLMWWLTIYTTIIPKYFKKFWYIDLLSGPGINLIQETEDLILGSPLLACIMPQNKFSHYIFIEGDPNKASMLNNILEFLSKEHLPISYEVINGDCNTIVPKLPLNECEHFFAFIDYEGLVEVDWNTVNTLLSYPSDILIVFQTDGIRRVLEKAKKSGKEYSSLNRFFGDNTWKVASNVDELLELYKRKIKKYRSFVDSIKIRGKYSYDIILACKAGPYIRAWIDLKRVLSAVRDKDVEFVLKICKGNISTLEEFFSPDTGQTTLKMFSDQ